MVKRENLLEPSIQLVDVKRVGGTQIILNLLGQSGMVYYHRKLAELYPFLSDNHLP